MKSIFSAINSVDFFAIKTFLSTTVNNFGLLLDAYQNSVNGTLQPGNKQAVDVFPERKSRDS